MVHLIEGSSVIVAPGSAEDQPSIASLIPVSYVNVIRNSQNITPAVESEFPTAGALNFATIVTLTPRTRTTERRSDTQTSYESRAFAEPMHPLLLPLERLLRRRLVELRILND